MSPTLEQPSVRKYQSLKMGSGVSPEFLRLSSPLRPRYPLNSDCLHAEISLISSHGFFADLTESKTLTMWKPSQEGPGNSPRTLRFLEGRVF